MNIQKLKFYNWLVDFSTSLCLNHTDEYDSVLQKKLMADTLFFYITKIGTTKNFPDEYFWEPIMSFFLDYPDCRLNPSVAIAFIFKENRFKNSDNAEILYTALRVIFHFWLFLPECISALKKYYPVLNVEYGYIERLYLDSWINALPVFEDLLGHLLINDTPLVKPYRIRTVNSYIILKPPVQDDINFSLHLQKYYFRGNFAPSFSNVIKDYLDNRPELKEKVLNEWKKERVETRQISKNLEVYFICNYLIKNISKFTLRFVVANTSLFKHGPVKQEILYLRETMLLEFDKASRKNSRQYALKELQKRQAAKAIANYAKTDNKK